MLIMRDINNFIQNHNTLTLATERNHEVFAAALFYVPVDNCKALIFVSKNYSDYNLKKSMSACILYQTSKSSKIMNKEDAFKYCKKEISKSK